MLSALTSGVIASLCRVDGEVSMMTEEAKKAKNAYMKQWRKKNPDKVKANTARYWEKKARERMEQEEVNENAENVPNVGMQQMRKEVGKC